MKPDYETLYIFDKLTETADEGYPVKITCSKYPKYPGGVSHCLAVKYSTPSYTFTICKEHNYFIVDIESFSSESAAVSTVCFHRYWYIVGKREWCTKNTVTCVYTSIEKDVFETLHPHVTKTLHLLEKVFREAVAPSSVAVIRELVHEQP
jgi:hypothetical protein